MVLAALGSKITGALKDLQKAPVISGVELDECLKTISTALLHADVNVKLVVGMKRAVKSKIAKISDDKMAHRAKIQFVQRAVVEELAALLQPADESRRVAFTPERNRQQVMMFVGLQGAGKTTTVVKVGHFYARKGFRVGVVCADTFRAGAFDQLKQSCAKAKLPFYGSYVERDPVAIARAGVAQLREEKFELILVDTSGRNKQEAALFDEMQNVCEAVTPDDVVYIMDSHIGQACFDQAKAFQESVGVGSVIVTKLDGHAKGGGAMSAVAATGAPLSFIGTGEHFHQFEQFEARGFVSRLLGMGDIGGLLNQLKENMGTEKSQEMVVRMTRGELSLRDLRTQLENIAKMGPLSQIMSMLPGLSQMMPAGVDDADGAQVINRQLTMFKSFTNAELDGEVRICESRIKRAARGAGVPIDEANQLLEMRKAMASLGGMMGGMMGGKGAGKGAGGKKDMMKAMSSMSSMMGGKGHMMKMAQQMQKGGGMGDIMKMAGQMMGKGGGGTAGLGGGGGGMPNIGDLMGSLGGMLGGGGGKGGDDPLAALGGLDGLDPNMLANLTGKGRGRR